jgi:hypothetical protein
VSKDDWPEGWHSGWRDLVKVRDSQTPAELMDRAGYTIREPDGRLIVREPGYLDRLARPEELDQPEIYAWGVGRIPFHFVGITTNDGTKAPPLPKWVAYCPLCTAPFDRKGGQTCPTCRKRSHLIDTLLETQTPCPD